MINSKDTELKQTRVIHAKESDLVGTKYLAAYYFGPFSASLTFQCVVSLFLPLDRGGGFFIQDVPKGRR